MTTCTRPGWSRRDLLKAAGLAGLGATVFPSLSACGVGGGERHPNGASAVTGSFDWQAAKGQTVRILQTPHPYQQSFQPLLKEFTELTVRFHLRLALAARNVMLTSFLREVLNRMALYGMRRAGTLMEDQIIERGCVLYEHLYEILIRSDVDAADSWVDQHIHFVQDLYDFEVAKP